MTIDAGFGDDESFRRLVSKLHDNGIKVMLDAVFNHCGVGFAPFQDVLKNQEKSKYKDWFHIRKFPIEVDETLPSLPQSPDENPYTYDRYAFERQMPKLKTENPEVRKYLLEVAKYWIEKCDIDGWRLDVANEIEHDFWRDFRRTVRAIKPDVFILGEIWHDSLPWLMGDQFDSVMNYQFQNAAVDLALNRICATQFRHTMTRLLMSYPSPVNQTLFNLIGSHDTERILTKLGGDVSRLQMLLALEFTSVGTPCIYYGDEVGMEGPFDPGCRRCMVWDEIETNSKRKEMLEFHKNLIHLRRNTPALYSSQIEFLEPSDNVQDELLVFRRQEDVSVIVGEVSPVAKHETKNAGSVLVAINSSSDKTVALDLTDKAFKCPRGTKLRIIFASESNNSSQQGGNARRLTRSKSIIIPTGGIHAADLNISTRIELGPSQFVILLEEYFASFASITTSEGTTMGTVNQAPKIVD